MKILTNTDSASRTITKSDWQLGRYEPSSPSSAQCTNNIATLLKFGGIQEYAQNVKHYFKIVFAKVKQFIWFILQNDLEWWQPKYLKQREENKSDFLSNLKIKLFDEIIIFCLEAVLNVFSNIFCCPSFISFETWLYCSQCDQSWRFFALWATF